METKTFTTPPTKPPLADRITRPYEPKPIERPSKVGWVIAILILLLLLGLAAYFLVPRLLHGQAAAAGHGDASNRAVPVVITTARKADLPLYLEGLLGSVTPLNTVTVHTRVDGQIMKVAYKEGQTVKEGDPLIEIDPRPFQAQLEQFQGQLTKDQAVLKLYQSNIDRDRSAGTAISAQQLDTDTSNAAQAEGAVKVDQAQIDSAQLNITYCHVTAPLGGRIGLRLVDQGNIVHAADATGVAVITQLQPITVLFTIAEDELNKVMQRPGGGTGLNVDAYDREKKSKLATGKVEAVDNQVDSTTGMVKLKATFTNEDSRLFPNQFLNVRLLVDTLKDGILVPTAAIQQGPENRIFVYVVKADQTVEIRDITTGPSQGDTTAITKNLAAGEIVVTDGVEKLQDGSKVTTEHTGNRAATRPSASTAAEPGQATTQKSDTASHPRRRSATPESE